MRFFIFVLILMLTTFTQPIMANDKVNVITVLTEKTDPNQPYHLYIKMPQLQGLANQQIQRQVNQNIRASIDKYINSFKQEIGESISGKQKSKLFITYKTIFVNQTYLSLMLEIAKYHPLMAHQDNSLQTLNYYLPEAKQLELQDLFITKDYLKPIADFAASELVARIPQLYGYDPAVVPEHFNYKSAKEWVLRGTEAREENYKHFCLQPQQLIIYFSYYQIAPRPAGVVELTIPLTTLQDIVQKKYLTDI